MLKSGNKLLTGTFAASAKSSASLTGLRMLKPTDEVLVQAPEFLDIWCKADLTR